MNLPSKDDVLEAFALEDTHDGATLDRYIRSYPDFAISLVDLARELTRTDIRPDDDLSDADTALIEAAWLTYQAETSVRSLSEISIEVQRKAAVELGVPRQVIIAFKEGQVLAATVPKKTIMRLARVLEWTLDSLTRELAGNNPRDLTSLSYKAEAKPSSQAQLSFERVLIDAGVPEDKRAELLSDTE